MKTIRWLLAGVLAGLAGAAARELLRGRWRAPAPPAADGREPVLGYDGMDQETLLDWLPDADLEPETIRRILHYEYAHRRREPVVSTLQEMLG